MRCTVPHHSRAAGRKVTFNSYGMPALILLLRQKTGKLLDYYDYCVTIRDAVSLLDWLQNTDLITLANVFGWPKSKPLFATLRSVIRYFLGLYLSEPVPEDMEKNMGDMWDRVRGLSRYNFAKAVAWRDNQHGWRGYEWLVEVTDWREQRLNAWIKALVDGITEGRSKEVSADAIDDRLDNAEERLDRIDARLDEVEDEFYRLEGQLDQLHTLAQGVIVIIQSTIPPPPPPPPSPPSTPRIPAIIQPSPPPLPPPPPPSPTHQPAY